jgi:hypothetical protein
MNRDPTDGSYPGSVTRNPIGFHRMVGSDRIRSAPVSDSLTWVLKIKLKYFLFIYSFRYSIINPTILSCLKETILYMVVNNVLFDYGIVKSYLGLLK